MNYFDAPSPVLSETCPCTKEMASEARASANAECRAKIGNILNERRVGCRGFSKRDFFAFIRGSV